MNNMISYVEAKILDSAKAKWLFQNLHFMGEKYREKSKYFDFAVLEVVVQNDCIVIESACYKNQISIKEFQSAQEAAAMVYDHLKYVDTNYQRLQKAPEDYLQKSFFKKVFGVFG